MSLLMQFSYVKKGTSKPQVFTVPPVNTELLTKSDFQTLDTMAVHVSRAFQQASCSYQSIATHPPLSFDYRQEFSTYLPPISNQGHVWGLLGFFDLFHIGCTVRHYAKTNASCRCPRRTCCFARDRVTFLLKTRTKTKH